MKNNDKKLTAIAVVTFIAAGALLTIALLIPSSGKTAVVSKETLEKEHKIGQAHAAASIKLQKDVPFVTELPYIEDTFRVDYGISQKSDSDDTALYVTYESDADKQLALDWLKSKDADLSNYEIIYDKANLE